MKKFISEYGFGILVAIAVIVLICLITPVGNVIGDSIKSLVNNFGEKTNSVMNVAGDATEQLANTLKGEGSDEDDETITNLTGYTWIRNNIINESATGDADYDINFIDLNRDEYIMLNLWFEDANGLYYSDYSDFFGVYDEYWFDNDYKTIQIVGGTDVTNSNLIDWLQANGTLTKIME